MSKKRGSRMDTPQDRIWHTLTYTAENIRTAQCLLSIALENVHTAMETCTPYAGKDDTYGSIFTNTDDMENALAWINDQAAQAQVELARIPKSVLGIRHELTRLEKKATDNE